MNRKKLLILGVGLLVLITSCSLQIDNKRQELVIFAASSLTNAFEELALQFEKHYPDTELVLSFGSSSQLATQILEGISGDIFASANEYQMDNIDEAGEIIGEPKIFATNTLIIAVPKENPLNIQTLNDLTRSNLRLVLAVPNTPIREYSDQLIQSSLPAAAQRNFYQNLASEEANVRQVVTKIALGEADAGIVYSSDISSEYTSFVLGIPIASNNITARYPIAILSRTNDQKLAEKFVEFALSDEGQSILLKWGFGKKP